MLPRNFTRCRISESMLSPPTILEGALISSHLVCLARLYLLSRRLSLPRHRRDGCRHDKTWLEKPITCQTSVAYGAGRHFEIARPFTIPDHNFTGLLAFCLMAASRPGSDDRRQIFEVHGIAIYSRQRLPDFGRLDLYRSSIIPILPAPPHYELPTTREY